MFNKKVKESELVSVIIPSYNHKDYINLAVNSVLNQTYNNIELIVIDDGSTDESLELLQNIDDKRIKIFSQDNKGAHYTINRGLEMAQGDFIAILNSDDIFDLNRIKYMMDIMKKNSDVSLISSWIEIIDSKGKKLGIKEGWMNCEPWTIDNPDKSFKRINDYKLNLMMTNFVSSTSNIFMRRTVYEKTGGMRNLRFAHDWDFLLRAAEHFECFQINKPLLKYRIHNTNTISTNRKWMLFEICWVLAANLTRYINKYFYNSHDTATLIKDVEKIAESINFQGNDKVFWMIKMFIDVREKNGFINPEEILLEDKNLREKFIEYVIP